MSKLKTALLSCAVGLSVLALGHPAIAAEGPGLDALKVFKEGPPPVPVVQNRFFEKTERFELAPLLGYVPNNPMARRYVGGVVFGYHFNEQFGAEATLSYSPDLGQSDLKGLAKTLVRIAHNGAGGADFQQPLDKVTLSAIFAATWAPLYGKINLLGEKVLSFDLYGVAGVGILSKANYRAVFDENAASNEDPVRLMPDETNPNEALVSGVVGVGSNFFLNQTVALKIDARFALYVDNLPQYDQTQAEPGQRLYNNFVASAGLAFFFPNMKPRLYDF